MQVVNIHEAKTQLSRYLQEVEAGGEVVKEGSVASEK